MQDDKKISQDASAVGAKSTETAQAARSGATGKGPPPAASVSRARWKHWHSKSSFLLMLLGAFAVVVYLMRSGLAKQYEGLGAALCAVACGGFLVWHTVHLFVEQDVLEEKLIHGIPTTDSSPGANPIGNESNPTTPTPEQNFK